LLFFLMSVAPKVSRYTIFLFPQKSPRSNNPWKNDAEPQWPLEKMAGETTLADLHQRNIRNVYIVVSDKANRGNHPSGNTRRSTPGMAHQETPQATPPTNTPNVKVRQKRKPQKSFPQL